MASRLSLFMFPGQGSQQVGMGKELAANFEEMARTFEEASDALGLSLQRLCFEDPEGQLNLTEFTQPAILTVSVGTARVLARRGGLTPSLVAGHSLGEYSALVATGALAFGDAVKAVRFRGQAMQRAVPVGVGAMAAYVGAQAARVVDICGNESRSDAVVEVVNFNSRTQLVLSGHKHAVEKVSGLIGAEKLGRAIPLAVSAPFHSSLMKSAADEMESYLHGVPFQALQVPLFANVDAKPYEGATYGKPTLVRQIASAVLWTQTLDAVRAHTVAGDAPEARRWIEVGPGSVLQGLLKKTLEGETAHSTHDLDAVKALLSGAGA
jgi:[acyl-carrier-protein] S-malonyltransferase